MRDSLERVREGGKGGWGALEQEAQGHDGIGVWLWRYGCYTCAHPTGTREAPESNHNKNPKNLGSEFWQLRYTDG